ncbi:MAG: DUF6527 family protein [Acidimicrobiia bacterium]
MRKTISHEFVEYIPDELEEGTVYVSIIYRTAVHACCCGCGREVITPLAPDQWELTYNGAAVSLSPSIGSWSFPCQSHYWITRGTVHWARRWSQQQIESARKRQGRHGERACEPSETVPNPGGSLVECRGIRARVRQLLRRPR